jgi:hypothetical protein
VEVRGSLLHGDGRLATGALASTRTWSMPSTASPAPAMPSSNRRGRDLVQPCLKLLTFPQPQARFTWLEYSYKPQHSRFRSASHTSETRQPRDQASYSSCFTTSPARRLSQFRYPKGSHWRRRSSTPIKTTATTLATKAFRRAALPASLQREPLDT